jgi:hypothetical protein
MRVEIDVVNDVVPPVIVTAANIMAQKNTTFTFAGQNLQQTLNIAMAVGGWVAGAMGWGGKYSHALKILGIAATPGVLINLYNRVGTPTTPASIKGGAPVRMSRVSRYPAPAPQQSFQGARLV